MNEPATHAGDTGQRLFQCMTESYDRQRDQAARRQKEQSRAGREIGPLPAVKNKRRKRAAGKSFLRFLNSYFPEAFPLKWSPDHKDLIKKVERSVREKRFIAAAYPRGFGKTSIFERACMWAVSYGLAEYVFMLAATKEKALDNLEAIRLEFMYNDRLAEDFPEICHPIRALDGIANRVRGQLLDGASTRIVWKGNRIVLPAVKGSPASGAVIGVGGLTGSEIRGAKYLHPSGRIVRPSLCFVDDAMTKESARSSLQNDNLEALITSDARGMAGPGESISMMAAMTIIEPNDLADRLTNRKLNPEWHGERHAFLLRWPERMDLWEEYGRLFKESLADGENGEPARAYYRKNRKRMDRGAKVSWPQMKKEDDTSAIEYALRLSQIAPDFFFREVQNDPQQQDADELQDLLTVEEIAEKQHNQKRGLVPLKAERLSAFIDCHQRLLYYAVVAWREQTFTGYVVDYGTFPEQSRRYYSLRDARPTLKQKFPGAGVEGALRKGLDALAAELRKPWQREDGTSMAIERCLVDAGWQEEIVKTFCRETDWPAATPSKGIGVGAKKTPFSEWGRKPGERVGTRWRLRTDQTQKVRYAIYDTNYWKSRLHNQLGISIEDPGCLSLFRGQSSTHRMLAEHLRSEKRTRVEAAGRTVDEWDSLPAGQDNHFFDCLVGAMVAASMVGCRLPEESEASGPNVVKGKSWFRQQERR